MNKNNLIILFTACLTVSFCVKAQNKKFEMRGVWIATVANIDWPSQPGLNSIAQKQEMLQMLDKLQANNINCIVFQVRPTSDAFYPSPYELWSHYLTGRQGKKPEPYYDPLQFIIEEAHKRCMEVHLWLNPYRVTNSDNLTQLSRDNLFFRNDSLFVKYGSKYYFNPGLDDTRNILNNVVEDLVERYDMDAIHFDDYFYPYPEDGKDFPDDGAFKKYPRGFKNKADWRRNNVNMVISELQQTIKTLKPWVEFGISPFGVWRNSTTDPAGSKTQAGIQNYDDLYADILKWLREGSIDYVVPQLYWEIGKKAADYKTLIQWWCDNSYGKNLYIGLYASGLKVNNAPAWKNPNEITRQLNLNKNYPQVEGAVFFSAKPFLSNIQGLNDSLKINYYKYPALNPINKNTVNEPSAQVQNLELLKDKKQAMLVWDKVGETSDGCRIAYYVVYAFKGKKTGNFNDPANIIAKTVDNMLDLEKFRRHLKGNYTYAVTAVNRFRVESVPSAPVIKKL